MFTLVNVGHSVCPLSLGPLRKLFVCHHALLFQDWIAAQYWDGWDENGFDRDKKGLHFGFYLM